jgi:hypothetical protein
VFHIEKRRSPVTGPSYPWIVRSIAMANLDRATRVIARRLLQNANDHESERGARTSGVTFSKSWPQRQARLAAACLPEHIIWE